MPAPPQERRRRPRLHPREPTTAVLPVLVDVEVLDISLSGLLFSTPREFRRGQRAQLRLLLGPDLLSAGIEVCRVQRLPTAEPTFAVGAKFVDLDDATARTLDRILRSVGEPH
jgi:hypothetical protein